MSSEQIMDFPPPAYSARASSSESSIPDHDKILARFRWPEVMDDSLRVNPPSLLKQEVAYNDDFGQFKAHIVELVNEEVKRVKQEDQKIGHAFSEDKFFFRAIRPFGESGAYKQQNWRLTTRLLRYGLDIEIGLTPACLEWERKQNRRSWCKVIIFTLFMAGVLVALAIGGMKLVTFLLMGTTKV